MIYLTFDTIDLLLAFFFILAKTLMSRFDTIFEQNVSFLEILAMNFSIKI